MIPYAKEVSPNLIVGKPSGGLYVATNNVVSADGRLADESGRVDPLSDRTDRAMMKALRHHFDAVLTGSGTFNKDPFNPPADKLGIVMVGDTPLRDDNPFWKRPSNKNLIILPDRTARKNSIWFDWVKARSLTLVTNGGEEPFVMSDEFFESVLLTMEVSKLLIEGGQKILDWLHFSELIDEMFVTEAPVVVGGPILTVPTGTTFKEWERPNLKLVSLYMDGGYLFKRYEVRYGPEDRIRRHGR